MPTNHHCFSAAASDWDEVGAEWSREGRDALWRTYCDERSRSLLRKFLPGDLGRVLKTDVFDEAVAAGIFPLVQARAQSMTGIDVSPVILEAARRKYPEFAVSLADVCHLPFADEAFETVISISTLDHFHSRNELQQALAELRRVLAPGGRMLLTLDNGQNPVVALRGMLPSGPLRWLQLVPYDVGWNCGARCLSALMREAGFRIQEMTQVEHCPRVLAVPLSRLLARFGSARSRRQFVRTLLKFEALERWPTRPFTGHYVAVLATRA